MREMQNVETWDEYKKIMAEQWQAVDKGWRGAGCYLITWKTEFTFQGPTEYSDIGVARATSPEGLFWVLDEIGDPFAVASIQKIPNREDFYADISGCMSEYVADSVEPTDDPDYQTR